MRSSEVNVDEGEEEESDRKGGRLECRIKYLQYGNLLKGLRI